ncbi:MAG: hypothetical protein HY318_04385 [Armatimonadetes bacterium]|nr:hypothetical protein [Armatimonadota bacterium]
MSTPPHNPTKDASTKGRSPKELLQALRGLDPALMVSAFAVFVFSLLVVRRSFPLGIPGEWVWQYRTEVTPWTGGIVPLIAFVLLATVCFYFGERADMGQLRAPARCVGLTLCVLLSYGIRSGMRYLSPVGRPAADDPALVVISPVATSYFMESLQIDTLPGGVRQFMREFPERMLGFSYHAQTHPPGTLLFYWVVRKVVRHPLISGALLQTGWFPAISDTQKFAARWNVRLTAGDVLAAEVLARLMPLLGCLFVVPVFCLLSGFGGESLAWRGLLVAATVPCLLVFLPTIDQVYVPIASWVFLLFTQSLDSFRRPRERRGAVFAAAVSGLWLGLGLMMTLAFLSLFALLTLLSGMAILEGRRKTVGTPVDYRRGGTAFLAFLAGVAAPIVAGYLFLDIDFFGIARTALTAHHTVTADAFSRTYWKWIFVDPLDFGGGLGIALCMMCCVGVLRLLRTRKAPSPGAPEGETSEARATATCWWLGAAWALTLIALDLSGVVRAEVARIWMFFYPVGVLLCGCLYGKTRLKQTDSLIETGRQDSLRRVRMNLELTFLAGLQLVQAIVLQREVVFIRFF